MPKRLTTHNFIKKAQEIHGTKYNYSNVSYINNQIKVVIGCKLHGDFLQTPDHHVNMKNGCPSCAPRAKSNRHNFIKKAQEIHGTNYDYSKTQYVNARTKVIITCKEHGNFEQTPAHHISHKQGCPFCATHGFKVNEPGVVYILDGGNKGCKIGITKRLKERLADFNNKSVNNRDNKARGVPFEFTLGASYLFPEGLTAQKLEASIHKELATLNCGHTGFDGATEWFNISASELIARLDKEFAEYKQTL